MRKRLLLAAATLVAADASVAETVELTIDTDEPIGRIDPNIYGQFVEHLGRGIYDGIWVGKDSDIPNRDGYRLDVLDALMELDVPVMRWPGGCFADQYHWRDGIGPAADRPARLNASWGGLIEPNSFGTHEFFNLAELLGAQTYLNFNVATGTPQEAVDWLEYITSDSASALAKERRTNGRDEPWQVDFYSIGNETWGCGGNLRPAYYADLYAKFATFLKVAGDDQPKRIISGSHEGNIDYSRVVLEHPAVVNQADGISVHFYTLPTSDWSDKGDATGFPEAEWISTLARTLRMNDIIAEQLAMLDAVPEGGELGLYVDEWGVWTNPSPGEPGGVLFQQNTIRDAIVAALNLDIFHRHADRVPMTNIAQMVNVLQAMILTDEERMVPTPTYHVYHMYKPFQGASSLPVAFESPAYRHDETSIPALSASAARTEDGSIVLALTNADPRTAHRVDFGGHWRVASGEVLTGETMDAHNSFDRPGRVAPRPLELAGTTRIIEVPPQSVMVLSLEPSP